MGRVIIIALLATLVTARPELYKEKEDFQFSRSSTDEGHKSGFYGAQRGNMGGNYEKSHNMDHLAQHQMSGLVNQVEGELGDTAKSQTGSVFTSSNSRGVYGLGRYNTNNLQGRNFQEGTSLDSSQSHSSIYDSEQRLRSSSAMNQYGTNYLQNSDYDRYKGSLAEQQAGGSHYGYGQESSRNSGYFSNSEHEQRSSSQSEDRLINSQSRLSNVEPIKIMIRPGSHSTLPITAHAVHNTDSYYDKNSITSDVEVLTNHQKEIRPTSEAKHYDSSYSYRKEWEKKNIQPESIPLSIPYVEPLGNSELHEDSNVGSRSYDSRYRLNGIQSQNSNSNSYKGYHSNLNSDASMHSQHEADYSARQQNYNSGSSYNALNSRADTDSLNLKPKGYQSSYSYHKSWERQGDPYVIVPDSTNIGESQKSEKLLSGYNNINLHSSQYGLQRNSHQGFSDGGMVCCQSGAVKRQVRSVNYGIQQQAQTQWDSLEELGQQSQTQFSDLKDLGQQSQSSWSNLEDLGQRTQNNMGNYAQQSGKQLNSYKETGQQSLNSYSNLEDLGQQSQKSFSNLEDLGQQSQNSFSNLEDLDQQSQNSFSNLEDLGQQSQNSFSNLEDLGQQSQNSFSNLEDLGQQSQNRWP